MKDKSKEKKEIAKYMKEFRVWKRKIQSVIRKAA